MCVCLSNRCAYRIGAAVPGDSLYRLPACPLGARRTMMATMRSCNSCSDMGGVQLTCGSGRDHSTNSQRPMTAAGETLHRHN